MSNFIKGSMIERRKTSKKNFPKNVMYNRRRIAKSEQAKPEGFKDVAGIPLNAFSFGAKNGRFSVYKS